MAETAVVSGGKPLRVRMVVVGAEGTGKSCLIKRYCEKRFVPRYAPTVGIDYGATKIYVDRRAVAVHIFDTSGARVFRDVRNEFYRDAHGVVLVFDVARRETFDALCHWTKEIYLELAKEGRDLDKAVVMVCANKTDLKARQVRSKTVYNGDCRITSLKPFIIVLAVFLSR
jgi:DnaJ family protein C protein 27